MVKRVSATIGGRNVLRAGCDSPPAVMVLKCLARERLPGLRKQPGKDSRPGAIPGPTVQSG